MKWIAALAVLALFADSPNHPEAAIPYFTNVRDVHVSEPTKQNYFVVDEEIWMHARPDLGDLRLYDEKTPVQYALSEQREGMVSDEVDAKILNLGSTSGHTEFDLDMQGMAEYNRIRLRLNIHDFVATASVSGGDAAGKGAAVKLASSTLYDFSKEQLGSNLVLKLPSSNFRFLHITITGGIRPQDVKGAAVFQSREQKAAWLKVGSCGPPKQNGRNTILECKVTERAPVSRIAFHVADSQVNFRRSVTVEDAKGAPIAESDISRVRIQRGGEIVTDETLFVQFAVGSERYTVIIDNGDNSPLAIVAAEPVTLERRVYFDPHGKTGLKLYYGDDRLPAPIYDYARFFNEETLAAQAELGPGAHNLAYSGRPDERPWSERHTGILWAAMLVAVLALAFIAFRGLSTGGNK